MDTDRLAYSVLGMVISAVVVIWAAGALFTVFVSAVAALYLALCSYLMLELSELRETATKASIDLAMKKDYRAGKLASLLEGLFWFLIPIFLYAHRSSVPNEIKLYSRNGDFIEDEN